MSTIFNFDARIADFFAFARSAGMVDFFTLFTMLGKWYVVGVLAILVIFVLWKIQKQVYILPLLATLIGSEIFIEIAKTLFHRARPISAAIIENGFSFPSGHATIAVAFYGFLVYIIFREAKKQWQKTIALIIGLVIILAIGFSRIYLGVHYFSDVVVGYLLGALFLCIGVVIAKRAKR